MLEDLLTSADSCHALLAVAAHSSFARTDELELKLVSFHDQCKTSMAIMDKMKDLGRRMIGQGREVNFKNEVAKYAADHGVPPGEAQKAIFTERMRDVRQGMTASNLLESFPDFFQNFEAALGETVDADGVKQCLADAETPAFRSLGPITPTPADLKVMTSYFQQHFEKKKPSYAVIKDSAESRQAILLLMVRVQSDPRYAAAPDIETLLNSPANADLRADMGQILLSRQGIAAHERGFGNQLRFEKNMENLKESARELPAKMLLNPVITSLKGIESIVKGRASFSSVAEALKKVAGSLASGAWHGVKTLKEIVKTASSFLTKREK